MLLSILRNCQEWLSFFFHPQIIEVQAILGVSSSKNFPMRSHGNSGNIKSIRAQKFEFKAGLMHFWEFFVGEEALIFARL